MGLITPENLSTESPCIHRAKWVVKDADTLIENGYVRTEKGIVTDVGFFSGKAGEAVTDHGAGVILPSLINSHSHLELSAFKGKIPFDGGFKSWVEKLLVLRDNADPVTLLNGFKDGIDELKNFGCHIIGDVSTLGIFENEFQLSGLSGVFFREYLGDTRTGDYKCETTGSVFKSLAGHAPHTTSPSLLRELKKESSRHHLPFSIHLAESEEEEVFIRTGKGDWADFLEKRGIDCSSWPVTPEGPVKYLSDSGALDETTIAVHLLNTEPSDIEILKNRRVNVCLCPRSNLNLHGALPEAEKLYNAGLNLCLGTDSLASTESLSMFDEMNNFSRQYRNISFRDIFRMATVNGAKALGLEAKFGTIYKGKSAKIIYLPEDQMNNSEIITSLLKEEI